jgi:peptidoglycan/xylan/chitin deacetylase (PgdA/CDA1 family)
MPRPEFSYAKKGLFVRLTYLLVALINFAVRVVLRRTNSVVALCYHSVMPSQYTAFEQQMKYIRKYAVSLRQIEDANDGDKMVSVTFDDAFECLLENVVPVVRELRVPIAIFAVSGNLGSKPSWLSNSEHPNANLLTMSAEQLRKLAIEPGFTIGSHSSSHRHLGDLPTTEVEFELVSSKASLENAIGLPCTYLALPHGSYRPEVVEIANRLGYLRVLTLDEISLPSRWAPSTVGRFSASPDMWMIEFVLTVYGAYSWLYAWRIWIRQLMTSFACLRRGK